MGRFDPSRKCAIKGSSLTNEVLPTQRARRRRWLIREWRFKTRCSQEWDDFWMGWMVEHDKHPGWVGGGCRECLLRPARRQADPGSLKSDVCNHLGSKFNLCFSKVDCIFFSKFLFLFFNLNVLIYRNNIVPCTYCQGIIVLHRIKSLL